VRKNPQKNTITKTKKVTSKQQNIAVATNKKIVVVHGWDGDINKGWFPWLKNTLEGHGFKVVMEQMPNSDKPQIELWTETLKKICGNVDEQTYFVGHSIGCQTILRMLEKHESPKAGGAIFLAGWFNLKDYTYKEEPKLERIKRKIADPWVNTRIDFTKIQPKFSPGSVTAIFSDNDPYVDLNNAEAFKQKFDARIIIENGMGHYEEAEIDMLPILVQEIFRITKNKQ
jgi:predicted alpha/beta hydrolase family esterase